MFDILFKRVTVINGSGEPGFVADVAVKNSKIQAISQEIEGKAIQTIKAEGLVLSPGFADIHGHSDLHLLDYPNSQIKLRQGVTLDIAGNCGFSVVPLCTDKAQEALGNLMSILGKPTQPIDFVSFTDYSHRMEARGLGTNMAMYIGHNTLRAIVMGLSDAVPTLGQIEKMKKILGEGLNYGAMGLSTGLIYIPGCYSATEEIIELAKVLKQKGGIYVSHIRNESSEVLAAIEEAIKIGREAKVPVHISHLKVSGSQNWHLSEKILYIIDKARSQGVDITCDVYPYTSASTTLLAVLPPWALVGGVPDILKRLDDKTTRQRMIKNMKSGLPGWHNLYLDAGWDKIKIASVESKEHIVMEGITIADLAANESKDPFDFVFDFLQTEGCNITAVYEVMSEEVVKLFLTQPYTMVASDGIPVGSKPHPRLYGTFPRIIARFVREKNLFTIEEAIKKMSSMPNQRLGITDRGLIKVGNWADLVLFDPNKFTDTATYDEPCQYPAGINMVMVNGNVVLENDVHHEVPVGKFLCRQL